MNHKPPAIILGCHKAGLGIIRALGEAKVPVVGIYYNKLDMGFVSKFVVSHYLFPHPDTRETEFTEKLLGLTSKWGGGVLIPSDDATLVHVSRNKELLEEKYKVVAPSWEITEKFIEKKYTYSLAEKIGVAAPKTRTPQNLNEVKDFAKVVGFPCIIKPSIGHSFYEIFKKKMIFAETIYALEEAYKITADSGAEMMIQEYIPGDDQSGANYNSFFFDNKPVFEMTAQKVRLSPPKTGFPRVVVSRSIPDIIYPGRKILNGLGYNGFSCTEFKKDARDGKYKLMEVNGRLNLSSILSYKCGVNFALIAYRQALGFKLPELPIATDKEVYWIDIGRDLIETVKNYKRENISIREYVKPYYKKNIFTVLSIKDPMPFLKRSLDILNSIPKYIYNKTVKKICIRS
ncbi:MAG TPA: hypothetical protein VGL27_03190 [Negativicutes bacterium]